ncbi:MAG: hypothetical protein KF861_07180 [Planctomycetaceae bacterium]|nr:hypothetical protein [Planctomycetaceae bacterium]
MTTINDGRRRDRGVWIIAALALAAVQLLQNAAPAQDGDILSDEAICVKMIEQMADQIQTYCIAHNLKTLQYLKFVGNHGTVSNETLEQRLIDSLKKRGIDLLQLDSTRLRGRLVSQKSGAQSVLLVQCTLTDISGAELQTFRLRQVVNG